MLSAISLNNRLFFTLAKFDRNFKESKTFEYIHSEK
jgi:hypothetical protein